MSEFLSPTDDGAFADYPLRQPMHGLTKMCPRCEGHGGWNLRLNAYPLHDKADTAQNRHAFSHFKTGCGHCYGYGYVQDSETCEGHDWKFEKNLGRCYNRYACSKCNQTMDVDSSD